MSAKLKATGNSAWKTWRERALKDFNLQDIYGDILTGRNQGKGWLEARDPRSKSGDRDPSCGVSDGEGDCERGRFKSFIDDCNMSVFDYLVQMGKASDFNAAYKIIAESSRVPLPITRAETNGKKKNGSAAHSNGAAPPASPSYALNWITSSEFAHADYKPSWIIEKIFVANQPGFGGGPSKSLKTSIMADAAISIGTATAFLGKFRVPRTLRVGIISGESGRHALQQIALRICQARGVALANANILWEFCLPQLANQEHLAVLSRSLKERGVEVLFLDPLYLSLLAGNEAKGLQASNMFDVGPLLMNVSQTCLNVGCTPFLVHHTKRNLVDPFEPLQLEDLAYAGCAEFARQWLLINRRAVFEPALGQHKLWLVAGGSEGQSQLLALDIDEGILQDDFTGRQWSIKVMDSGTARQDAQMERDLAKDKKKQQQAKNDGSRILGALEKLDPNGQGVTQNKLRDKTGMSGQRCKSAIEALLDEGILTCTKGEIVTGNGAKRETDLYRHARHTDEGAV